LRGLAAALTVAMLLAAPSVASAAPQWRLNGLLAGLGHQGVIQFGTLTLKSQVIGEVKCKIVAGAPVWNESAKGVNAVEGWGSVPCKSPECMGQPVVTAEDPVELIEETLGSEKHWKAKRGSRTLPWPGELFETTEKTISLNVHKFRISTLGGQSGGLGQPEGCPDEGIEVVYEGNLEPKLMNGSKNGLSPSKLVFEGALLCTPIGPPPCGSEGGDLFVSGELTMLGTNEQLITAR
jgi:hypothetical protein